MLHEQTLAFVREERRLTGRIIENLQKISDQKLHLKMGYSSLFEYATKALVTLKAVLIEGSQLYEWQERCPR